MCIIVIQPEGYTMTEDQILDFIERNPHGFGFMWADKKGLHMKKIVSDDPDELIDFYNQHAAGKAGVLHYRFATSGPVNTNMAHPFKVSDDLYVVHNGVLAGGSETESDTAQFVREVLKPLLEKDYTRLYDPKVKAHIEQQIGGSALVFLDRDGVVTKVGNRGVDWDGCWYSNTYAWTVPPELGGWRGYGGGSRSGDPRAFMDIDTDPDLAEIEEYAYSLEPEERAATLADLENRLHDGEYLSAEESTLFEILTGLAADDADDDWDTPTAVTRFLLDEMERDKKKSRSNPRFYGGRGRPVGGRGKARGARGGC